MKIRLIATLVLLLALMVGYIVHENSQPSTRPQTGNDGIVLR